MFYSKEPTFVQLFYNKLKILKVSSIKLYDVIAMLILAKPPRLFTLSYFLSLIKLHIFYQKQIKTRKEPNLTLTFSILFLKKKLSRFYD